LHSSNALSRDYSMPDLAALSTAAVSIAFIHTVFGPDHYLPFVAMSRVGQWPLGKTALVTLLCGVGHVLGSVVLGCVGIAFGIMVLKLESIEEIRGDLAGWLLLTFGLLYFSWGLARALRNQPHMHVHGDGTIDMHSHDLETDMVGPSRQTIVRRETMTPWVLFTIFLFGPCEPLIPMLMYPAASGNAAGVVLVTALFGVTTVLTMLAIVLAMCLGTETLRLRRLERFGHALAGFVVLACAVAIKLGM
jgi:nickel/cobalt exporter